jgi:hypothetical protein
MMKSPHRQIISGKEIGSSDLTNLQGMSSMYRSPKPQGIPSALESTLKMAAMEEGSYSVSPNKNHRRLRDPPQGASAFEHRGGS